MKLHLPNSALINNIDPFLKSLDTNDASSLNITSHKGWVHVHPAVLCMVASLGLLVKKNEGNVHFEIMKCKSKHYFKRIGLFDFLGLDSKIGIEEHDSSGRFIPLTIIKDSSSLTHFLTEIIPILHKEPEQVAPMRYVLSELIRNVIEHSGSEAIVCVQRSPKSKTIIIGVADCGIGIKKAINLSYPEANDDKKAIKLALTPGITGTTRKITGTADNAALVYLS